MAILNVPAMTFKVVVLLSAILFCHGHNIQNLLQDIAERRRDNNGGFRRVLYGVDESASILGAPRYPFHLPEAEPILPGHTLLRPTLGMLKSALKFPHKEMENGAGVYGNTNNILGIKWDGTNERLAYSGFRRTPSDFVEVIPERTLFKASSDEDQDNNIVVVKRNTPNFGSPAWIPSHPYHKVPVAFSPNVPEKRNIFDEDTIHHSFHKFPQDSEEDEWAAEKARIKEYITHSHSNRPSGESIQQNDMTTPPKQLDNRLYNSPETLGFVKIMLKKMKHKKRLERRQAEFVVLKPVDSEGPSSGDLHEDMGYGYNPLAPEHDYDEGHFVQATEPPKNISMKTKWFLESKNMFHHVKFHSDAPDHDEHLPASAKDFEDDQNKWWYFHQYDYQPFLEIDR